MTHPELALRRVSPTIHDYTPFGGRVPPDAWRYRGGTLWRRAADAPPLPLDPYDVRDRHVALFTQVCAALAQWRATHRRVRAAHHVAYGHERTP